MNEQAARELERVLCGDDDAVTVTVLPQDGGAEIEIADGTGTAHFTASDGGPLLAYLLSQTSPTPKPPPGG